jgi:hypothetical protein
LTYNGSHVCSCGGGYLNHPNMGVKGSANQYAAPVQGVDDEGESLLVKGPAFGQTEGGALGPDQAWTHYLGDPWRLNASPTAVKLSLKQVWEATLPAQGGSEYRHAGFDGSRASPSTHDGERVYLTDPDAHAVYALDAGTGKPAWTYIADGPVDGPPALAQGCCVFGSGDGWLYVLRAKEGALVWKRRLARGPLQRPHYGQVQAAWPVSASVLLGKKEGGHTLVAKAGWYPHGKQSNWVYGLDLASGEVLWASPDGSRNPMLQQMTSDGTFWGTDLATGKRPKNYRSPRSLDFPEFTWSLARVSPNNRGKGHSTNLWAHAGEWSTCIRTAGDGLERLQAFDTKELLTQHGAKPKVEQRSKKGEAYQAVVRTGETLLAALTVGDGGASRSLLRALNPATLETIAEQELPAEVAFMALTPIQDGLVISFRDGRVVRYGP